MFDWFREIGEEISGIDSAAAKKERMEKREQKKINRFIFSNGSRALVIVLGIIYLIMAGSSIMLLKSTTGSIPHIVKYLFMSVVDLVVIFALVFGKRKGEIIALVGSFIFVVCLFVSTVLL